jgi:hypothetical protein
MNHKISILYIISFFASYNFCGPEIFVRAFQACAPIILASEARWAFQEFNRNPDESPKFPLSTVPTIIATSMAVAIPYKFYKIQKLNKDRVIGGHVGYMAETVINFAQLFSASSIGYAMIAYGYRNELATLKHKKN